MANIFCKNHKCGKLFDDSLGPKCPNCGHQNPVTVLAPCDMCDGMTHRLTKIDSGHSVCDTCLQEFQPHTNTILDEWKFKQILLRRQFGIRDDASYDDLFQHVLADILSRGGNWELCDETYIAGVNHTNADGTSRRDILLRCRYGETLKLVREPENTFQEDLRAVKVCRENGEQLGYIPSHKLGNDQGIGFSRLADDMDKGRLFQARLRTFDGMSEDDYMLSVIAEGKVIEDSTDEDELDGPPPSLTADIEIFEFRLPFNSSEVVQEAPQLAWQMKATSRRIAALRRKGVQVEKDASRLECWKHEQVVLRRNFGLQPDASHEDVVQRVYEPKRSEGGTWQTACYAEIVDVEASNPDGVSRREIIRRCRLGERLRLVREPENPQNDNAVMVLRETGEQLGYVNESWVIPHPAPAGPEFKYLSEEIDKGLPVEAEIVEINEAGSEADASRSGERWPFNITMTISGPGDENDRSHSGVVISIRVFVLPAEHPLSVERRLTAGLTPAVIPQVKAQEQVSHSEVVNTPPLEPLVEWSCPHCGASLTSPMQKVGMSGPCAFCRKTVVVPEPVPGGNPEYKPKTVEVRMVGLKTFQWPCPRCGLMNNTRLSSLGSRTRCKGCKLSINLPKTIGGF